ncbi:MAG: hypothetical protein A3G34_11455 [Candidatus Lindowbacteria bacterium RIFCSPLOWO2_12_FULL_62_27]|nr:MAG: hypothetical protein A3G34_11455 [Candidatus Lindowbacteria bacterium RIFCSPLOWO2_12_FULL_62_27]
MIHDEGAVGEILSDAEERFSRRRAQAGLLLGPALGVLIFFWPAPLSAQGHALSAILALVGTYWICEPIPISATALLGAALCVLLGVDSAKNIFAPFAHPLIFLFIGSFFLAKSMSTHGLDRRIASSVLAWRFVRGHPARVMLAFGGLTAFLSMWISNTAATAMMFPIALGLIRSLNAGRRYACGLMLMAAYASSVGGLATPVGTPPNLIGIGFIAEQAGVRITFFQWMLIGVPLTAVMFAVLFSLLYVLHPAGGHLPPSPLPSPARGGRGENTETGAASPLWSAGERNTLAAFGLAVSLWILPGAIGLACGSGSPAFKWIDARLNESVVALLAGCLLFLMPLDRRFERMTFTWRDAAGIDWGTILLFGGGLSLGDQMFKTGVAQALGGGLTRILDVHTLWPITGLSIGMAIVLSELTSNTAAASMVIPVAMAVAKEAGVPLLPPALGACLGASYGFCLPVSTPPNAIVYGSGLVPITKMVRAGILFDVIGFFTLWLGLFVLCPLLGLA